MACMMSDLLDYYHHESGAGVDEQSIAECLGTLYAGTY